MSETLNPGDKVNFNLDAVEDDPKGPYRFTVKDELFTTVDPRSLDWKVLASLDTDDAFEVLETIFTEEDYERFLKLTISARKIDALMEKIRDHYNLDGTKRGNRRGSRS